jgi:hypothetical protein
MIASFNEDIYPVTGKNIYLKKLNGTIIETFGTTSGNIITTGNTVKIIPTNVLESNTGYYIEIQSGAFKDRASNVFSGII